MGANIKGVFARFAKAVTACENVMKKEGYDFMHNDHLGFILVCPSNLGTGLRASVMVKIPHVSARSDFKQVCKSMNLQARGGAGVDSASAGGIWDISNSDRLGMSEVDLVNKMIEGCAKLVKLEKEMEAGGGNVVAMVATSAESAPPSARVPVGPDGTPDYSKIPGLGDDPYPGFPSDQCPDKMPDLHKHNSIMADVLKKDPSIYDALK